MHSYKIRVVAYDAIMSTGMGPNDLRPFGTMRRFAIPSANPNKSLEFSPRLSGVPKLPKRPEYESGEKREAAQDIPTKRKGGIRPFKGTYKAL